MRTMKRSRTLVLTPLLVACASAVSGSASLVGSSGDYHGAAVSFTGTLASGEEVFIFAGSYEPRAFTLTIRAGM